MKIYASYSWSLREEFVKFDLKLKDFFKSEFNWTLYSFVFDFKEKTDDQSLMRACLKKIEESDVVLVEFSNDSVGIGLEAGYAHAKGKKVIYLYKEGTELQQTINGIASYVIKYQSVEDVIVWFRNHENI